MKIKGFVKILIVFTVITLALCMLVSCAPNKKTQQDSGAFFWEVADRDGKKLYLLGSIHVADDDIYPFSDVIVNAFNESSALAVEVDIDALEKDVQMQIEVLQYFMYDDGSTIEDHIDEELFERAKQYLVERDMYSETYLLLKPIFWAELLSQTAAEKTGLSFEKGVDMYFLKAAKKAKKDILEVESAVDQASAMATLSDNLQAFYLEDTLNNVGNLVKETLDLYELWKEADVEKLEKYVYNEDKKKALSDEQLEVFNEFEKVMIVDRNKHMVEKAVEYINSGKTVFYVVGEAHMVGDSGLVNQLEMKGYKVVKR